MIPIVKIEKSITIDAPVEEVFDYTTTPEHLPEYLVSMLSVKDVKHLPNGDSSFKYNAQMFGFQAEGTGECKEKILNERATLKVHGAGMEFTAPTTFERIAGGKTRVASVAEYRFEEGAPITKFDETFLKKYLELASEFTFYTLKGRIELGVPVATR